MLALGDTSTPARACLWRFASNLALCTLQLLTDIMLSKSEARNSAGDPEAPAVPDALSEGGGDSSSGGGREQRAALQPDAGGESAAAVNQRGGGDELLCSAAALMMGGGGADFDLRQKSVELVTAIVVKQQIELRLFIAPLCVINAKAELATWLKSQVTQRVLMP